MKALYLDNYDGLFYNRWITLSLFVIKKNWRHIVRKVLSFLKPYKIPVIIAYSLTFVELIIELLLPFFLGKMINIGVKGQDLDYIIYWGSIMIGMSVFALIAGIINSFFSSHISVSFAYDLRKDLFKKIQEFSFKNLQRFPTSAIVTRFTNDVRQVQQTLFMGLRIMVRAPLLVIGGVIMAFVVNAKLALVFLITVPLLVIFIFWVLKKSTAMFGKVQSKVDMVNRVMQENLSNMRLVKAFLRRTYEESRFQEANKGLADITRSTFRFIEASTPILIFIMNLSLISILWFGNIQSIAGETDVGDVVAIVNYALRIAMAISMFTFITMGLSRAQASSTRLAALFNVNIEDYDVSQDSQEHYISKGKVTFDHVSFSYKKNSEQILHDVSFTVEPKERLAIMGATGAGKTTMFQLIPRLYDTKQGNIYIDERPISDYSLEHIRNNIGYVPQSPLLFSGSVRDNIAWGKENASEFEIIQAAKKAQIHDTIIQLPNQYDTLIGQRGVNLSGGQQQRLSIARALVRAPHILMLDDSTSALDVETEMHLLSAIEEDKCTTLIITQKVSTAMRADHILLLDKGTVQAIGTHDELIATSSLYKKIVTSQFGKEFMHENESY